MISLALSVRQAAQVDFAEFKRRFNRPTGIVIGLACQFVLLPLAGFASARVFYPRDPVHGVARVEDARGREAGEGEEDELARQADHDARRAVEPALELREVHLGRLANG